MAITWSSLAWKLRRGNKDRVPWVTRHLESKNPKSWGWSWGQPQLHSEFRGTPVRHHQQLPPPVKLLLLSFPRHDHVWSAKWYIRIGHALGTCACVPYMADGLPSTILFWTLQSVDFCAVSRWLSLNIWVLKERFCSNSEMQKHVWGRLGTGQWPLQPLRPV